MTYLKAGRMPQRRRLLVGFKLAVVGAASLFPASMLGQASPSQGWIHSRANCLGFNESVTWRSTLRSGFSVLGVPVLVPVGESAPRMTIGVHHDRLKNTSHRSEAAIRLRTLGGLLHFIGPRDARLLYGGV